MWPFVRNRRGAKPISADRLLKYVAEIGDAPRVIWRERESNEVFVGSLLADGGRHGLTFDLRTEARDLASVLAYYVNRNA